MFDCKKLVHPFQNDPGCSQSQRAMEDLLGGTAKIDGRTLADLLNYFTELSANVRYSYTAFNSAVIKESNWQPFFNNSLPFVLASAIKNDASSLSEKFESYNHAFGKRPSVKGLQLLTFFLYYGSVYKINKLYLAVKDSGLPVVALLKQLISTKLQEPVKKIITVNYITYKKFGIGPIDFTPLFSNNAWAISRNDFIELVRDAAETTDVYQEMASFRDQLDDAFISIRGIMNLVSEASSNSLEQSLLPLKDELKQRHTPHVALLFTFLKIFRNLQDDLNGYTKKHLDFFYKEVLRLAPKAAQPDKVHLVFELQKQLKQYALKKGLLLKADKDKNNTEVDFALNDEIVVNKTQVSDLRTLFLNNERAGDKTYIEGVYMATKANTADGIEKEFNGDSKNYFTLGGKYSKYISPGKRSPDLYPAARIAFILTSPVLLLNEGERTIEIDLTCKLNDNCKSVSETAAVAGDPCCKNTMPSLSTNHALKNENADFPDFIVTEKLYEAVQSLLGGSYIYISTKLIEQAKTMGFKTKLASLINEQFLKNGNAQKNPWCSDIPLYADEAVVSQTDWDQFMNTINATTQLPNFSTDERTFLSRIFKPFKPLIILFSGEKEWIDPAFAISVSALHDGLFTIHITAKIKADQPAVTFYNKENLKEDIGCDQPLVKIELNDAKKIALLESMYSKPASSCCLSMPQPAGNNKISLYHFFRNVVIADTTIHVQVCGLKNFIVQNDESVQDVNGPVYPFGTRPTIIDFDAVNSSENTAPENDYSGAGEKNLKGPNFYLGSMEIFFKKWKQVCVRLNWKDKPVDFNEHYKAYLKRFNIPNNKGEIVADGVYGLNQNDFEVNLSLLDSGVWNKEKNPAETADEKRDFNRKLFSSVPCDVGCGDTDLFEFSFKINASDFPVTGRYEKFISGLKKFDTTARKGFLRFKLENQDFLHKDYAFVLGRQMMALGRFPQFILEGAVYMGKGNTVIVYRNVGNIILNFKTLVDQAALDAGSAETGSLELITELRELISSFQEDPANVGLDELHGLMEKLKQNETLSTHTLTDTKNIQESLKQLELVLIFFPKDDEMVKDVSVLIPNEPWTPIISNMSLDYSAVAEKTDISLIHLYPYQNTYKEEQLSLAPALFPSYCDEGTLFIGLSDAVPGSNLNILFELAEATSDSESETQTVYWKYLSNNQWFDLRKGYEILEDGTENLTNSGIIKFALPENIGIINTVMPNGLCWIKAAVPKNIKSVCETLGIYTQAAEATFVINKENDTSRLSEPLKKGSVSKLKVIDANIKSVTQQGASFDGHEPEETKNYYLRVSELLQHKGRAINKFDYERLTLEAFPQVFKAKCINHSFKLDAREYDNDFPFAPGYVLIAVIPDLTKLFAGRSIEPKLPTGIIEKIESFLASRTSPFVKIKAVNPRYEKINFCLSVILHKNFDKSFYKEKLAEDLKLFLAPWAVGDFEKLRFGQPVNKSDIVHFLETRNYVDYITKMEMRAEFDDDAAAVSATEIFPHTARSILVAGNIQVCIEEDAHDDWSAAVCNKITTVMDYNKQVKIIAV